MYSSTTATKKILALNKRLRILQGGTGASKTISTLLYLIALAQSDKKATLTSIVSESMPHLRKGCIRDFQKIMKEHNYWKDNRWKETSKEYEFETGSVMEFFGADQAEKLRGGRRDRLFINECNNVSFEAFEELEVRTKEFVILDFNPTNEFWVFTDVIGKRDDSELIILTYKDNEALDKQIVDSIEQRKERKGWFTVYGLGQLGEVEGKIYKGWQIIDELPHEARLERYGLDFGYTNDPTAIVAVYRLNQGYILDEICFQKGLSNKQIADILNNQPKALVVADSAEPKSISEIYSYGVNIIGANKGADSVRFNIQIVQDQKMSMTKRSVNVIKEYRNFLWMTDTQGKVLNEPEHQFKHSMDATSYAFSSMNLKPKPLYSEWLREEDIKEENEAI